MGPTIRKRSQRILFTKSVVQILLWLILVTCIFVTALEEMPKIFMLILGLSDGNEIIREVVIQSLILVYPIGTIVGDIYIGRYKTIISGLVVIAVSLLSFSIGSMLQFIADSYQSRVLETTSLVWYIISVPIFIVGSLIFNSNIIQFGLDQLIDKPSEYLGKFMHWLVWAIQTSMVLTKVVYVIYKCVNHDVFYVLKLIKHAVPICFLALLLIFLFISWRKRHHLNHDGVLYNPYKMIYNVLKFSYKNKYPLSPISAFSSHTKLTRFDYAKEKYGGPFKNNAIEDVKYFKKIFLVLAVLGSVFTLDLPVRTFFNTFSQHTGFSIDIVNATCNRHLSPQFFSDVLGVFFLPVYIWIIYSLFHNRRPKILHRLLILVIIYISAVISMLIIDMVGHVDLSVHGESQPMCMFEKNNTITLNMHWIVMIFPGVTNEIYFILLATSLEFVSAQSPHAMRGVLIGAFYFIVGVFHTVSLTLFVPFRLSIVWRDGYLGNYPPVISCGFGYYLVCITVSVIGFVLLVFVVKWYQYRTRDEELFPHVQERNIAIQENTPRRKDYQELKD